VARLIETALAPRDAHAASTPHVSEEASNIVASVVTAFVAGRTEEQVAWAKRLTEAAPDHPIGWRYLAAGYAELDRTEEAQAAMKQYLRVTPHHSTEILRVTSLAQLPGLKERLIASLRKAGLPESG
jgi:predicted Zn-dependent protease